MLSVELLKHRAVIAKKYRDNLDPTRKAALRVKAKARTQAWRDSRTPEQYLEERRKERARYKLWRDRLFKELGEVCRGCGITDSRVLQVDHIQGQGRKDRLTKNFGRPGFGYLYFKRILETSDFRLKYQILCANCNWIKRAENGEYNRSIVADEDCVGRKYGEM